MNLCRAFTTILGRATKSKAFISSVIMIIVFRIMGFLPEMLTRMNIYQGHIYIGGDTLLWYDILGISFFALIIMIVPVIPYSSSFCDDYKSNYLTQLLMNMGKGKYCTITVLSCAISSFLCVFIGDAILVIGLSCIMPLYDINNYTTMQAVVLMLLKLIMLGLQGAFHGVVTMILSVFTLNKFIIYTSPIILYFFFMCIGENLLHIPQEINPSFIYKGFIFGEGAEIKSVLYALIYFLFVMFVAIRVLDKKIERCY